MPKDFLGGKMPLIQIRPSFGTEFGTGCFLFWKQNWVPPSLKKFSKPNSFFKRSSNSSTN
jgi:hypothetical protein